MSICVSIVTRKGCVDLVDFVGIGDPLLTENCKGRPASRLPSQFPTPPAFPDGGSVDITM